ncbi:hypothetical protein J6590_082451 [Homalodisca vitripennis]|nr:hypothetical protein J6590_082451 [Homalodisca vitripennis]
MEGISRAVLVRVRVERSSVSLLCWLYRKKREIRVVRRAKATYRRSETKADLEKYFEDQPPERANKPTKDNSSQAIKGLFRIIGILWYCHI